MDTEEIIKALSSVQFKQSLDWSTYIVIAFFSGLGGWFASYFKEKGKNYANKEDFNELKRQLTTNTNVVEGIKTELSEKSWINQQVWIKKQESYEAIFSLLFHVKKYVSHQLDEYKEWEYFENHYSFMDEYPENDGSLLERWEKDKAEYNKKVNSPETKKEAEEIKTKYDESISRLFEIIEVKSIYLDQEVGTVIKGLKNELSKTYDEEEWDDHFLRMSESSKISITKIREISKRELQIKT